MSDLKGLKVAKGVAHRIRAVERGLTPPSLLLSQAPERATIAERMEHYRVPGVSVAVINDYQIEWARGYGVLQAGRSARVTVNTLFQAGSLSKPVTAVAALCLVQRGILRLDEDVNEFLVSWKIPANGSWQPRVTLGQLLSHTGGTNVNLYSGYPADHRVPTLRQVLEGEKPANPPPVRVILMPGTQYRYSSGGYMILQQLLVDVTGLPFPELMRQLVLDPLGMELSTFEQPLPRQRWTTAAVGHRNGAQPVGGKWFVYPEAQGGLWTTPSDVARFLIEIQRGNAGRPTRVLSTEMARTMLTPQIEPHVGLGVFFDGTGDSRRIDHLGGNEGFSSRLSAFCDSGLGAVVMTNWHYGFLVDEVLRGIAREYAWPGYLPDPPRTIRMDPARCASYVGDYELRPDLHFRVRQGPDALSIELTGQAPINLVPRSETTFLMEAVNAEVTFERSETSEVTGAIFRQHDGTGGSASWFATRRRGPG